jgi:hypothetical protein
MQAHVLSYLRRAKVTMGTQTSNPEFKTGVDLHPRQNTPPQSAEGSTRLDVTDKYGESAVV